MRFKCVMGCQYLKRFLIYHENVCSRNQHHFPYSYRNYFAFHHNALHIPDVTSTDGSSVEDVFGCSIISNCISLLCTVSTGALAKRDTKHSIDSVYVLKVISISLCLRYTAATVTTLIQQQYYSSGPPLKHVCLNTCTFFSCLLSSTTRVRGRPNKPLLNKPAFHLIALNRYSLLGLAHSPSPPSSWSSFDGTMPKPPSLVSTIASPLPWSFPGPFTPLESFPPAFYTQLRSSFVPFVHCPRTTLFVSLLSCAICLHTHISIRITDVNVVRNSRVWPRRVTSQIVWNTRGLLGFVSGKRLSSDRVPRDVSIKRIKVRIISAMSVAACFRFRRSNENRRRNGILLVFSLLSYQSQSVIVAVQKKRNCQHCASSRVRRFPGIGVLKIV